MKEVTFPFLNLKLNVNPIMFSVFGINIYWYAFLIVSSIVIGIIICKKNNGRYGICFDDILELMIIVLPISIICARIYYVIFSLNMYIKNPISILNIRDGGLAIYGGIIGGAITIILYCKKKKISALDMLDYVSPCLALGQCIGRWGNFFNVEAHGGITKSIFRMGIIEKETYIEVHPTFLYESICTFIIFLILIIFQKKRKYKGQITYIYLAMYSFIRAIIEGFRTDSLMFIGFRISQILSIILFVVFTSILILKNIKMKNINNLNKNEE